MKKVLTLGKECGIILFALNERYAREWWNW